MVDVATEIQIKSPLGVVYEYSSHPDNASEWYVNIKSSEWITPKPLGVGSKIKFTAEFLGRQLNYVYEVVELIPEQKLIMRTANGPFQMETTYMWESLDENKTRMILINRGKPKGFSKLLTPFMEIAMRKANKKDLKLLKELIESKKNKQIKKINY
jgi:hypothetical protein